MLDKGHLFRNINLFPSLLYLVEYHILQNSDSISHLQTSTATIISS